MTIKVINQEVFYVGLVIKGLVFLTMTLNFWKKLYSI